MNHGTGQQARQIGRDLSGNSGVLAHGLHQAVAPFNNFYAQQALCQVLRGQYGLRKRVATGAVKISDAVGQAAQAGHVKRLASHRAQSRLQCILADDRVARKAHALHHHCWAARLHRTQRCRGLQIERRALTRAGHAGLKLLQNLTGIWCGLCHRCRGQAYRGPSHGEVFGQRAAPGMLLFLFFHDLLVSCLSLSSARLTVSFFQTAGPG